MGARRAEVEAELARAGDLARRLGAPGLEQRVEQTRSRLQLSG
jgi:hypothetical protein